MPVTLEIAASKNQIELGGTVIVTYDCSGAFVYNIQAENMPNSIDLGDGGPGSMKFLPTYSGDFTITLTAIGDVDRRQGIGNDQDETNSVSATITVN